MIGFDLDMTLIDSRPGVGASLRALADESGRPIDVPKILGSMGMLIEQQLAPWFGPDELGPAVARFREHMAAGGAEQATPLPGARAAIDAARERGPVMVVTAKKDTLAAVSLRACDLPVDVIVGGAWAETKSPALVEHGAWMYVGDHVADMGAAIDAGCLPIGVLSGFHTHDELAAAGAVNVLADLHGFAGLLAGTARTA